MQKAIFNIQNETDFERCALQVFKHQFENNKVYRSFCDLLYIHPSDVKDVAQIPFLPIQFFKTHQVRNIKLNQSRGLNNFFRILRSNYPFPFFY